MSITAVPRLDRSTEQPPQAAFGARSDRPMESEPGWLALLHAAGQAFAMGTAPRLGDVGRLIQGVISCEYIGYVSFGRSEADERRLSVRSVPGYQIGPTGFTPRPILEPVLGRRDNVGDEQGREHPRGCQFRLITRTAGDRDHGWLLVRRAGFERADLAWASRLLPLLILLDRAAGVEPSSPPAGSAGSSGPSGSAAGAHGTTPVLTPREVEVLDLVAAGLTADAIARRAGISSATVRKHLEHVYSKLGRHDRLTAVDEARRLGLLTR